MKRLKDITEMVSTLAVIAAAGVLVWVLLVKQPADAAAAAAPGIADVTETLDAALVRNVTGAGPLAIVEFTDFQCPYCKQHAEQTAPTLLKKIAGKARYVSMHFPLGMHPQAIPAAEAAECAAEQGKFWEMHAALFEHQQELAGLDYATLAGVEPAAFKACVAAGAAKARVIAGEAEARRLKVGSTPTLFIGRMRADGGVDLLKRISGAAPVDMVMAEFAKVTKG